MTIDVRAIALLAALASTLLPPTARAGADLALGKKIYAERCSPCHGDGGGGDGPASAALNPKPRNFRDPDFWRGRTVAQMRLIVHDGKPGTLMAPFAGVLSDAEIDAAVAYVQTFKPSPR